MRLVSSMDSKYIIAEKKTIHKISDLTENRTHELWVTVQERYPLRYHSLDRLMSFSPT